MGVTGIQRIGEFVLANFNSIVFYLSREIRFCIFLKQMRHGNSTIFSIFGHRKKIIINTNLTACRRDVESCTGYCTIPKDLIQ